MEQALNSVYDGRMVVKEEKTWFWRPGDRLVCRVEQYIECEEKQTRKQAGTNGANFNDKTELSDHRAKQSAKTSPKTGQESRQSSSVMAKRQGPPSRRGKTAKTAPVIPLLAVPRCLRQSLLNQGALPSMRQDESCTSSARGLFAL